MIILLKTPITGGIVTITSEDVPDPYVPVDGTMDVAGNLDVSNIVDALLLRAIIAGVAETPVETTDDVTKVGLWLENPTAATIGVQQRSPLLVLEGQAWAPDLAASHEVQYGLQTVTSSGAHAADGELVISDNINDGGWYSLWRFGQSSFGPVYRGDYLDLSGEGDAMLSSDDTGELNVYLNGTEEWRFTAAKNLVAATRGNVVDLSGDLGEAISSQADGYLDLAAGTNVRLSTGLQLAEAPANELPLPGYGQVWVKDDAPNTLWFTDDSGIDFQLGVGDGGIPGASGIDNRVARYNGTSALQSSSVTINDDGTVSGTAFYVKDQTGIYLEAVSKIGFSVAGDNKWSIGPGGNFRTLTRGQKVDFAGDLGEAIYSAADNSLDFTISGVDSVSFRKTGVKLTEAAAAEEAEAGRGQYWVRGDSPNTPWFTDDAGDSQQLVQDNDSRLSDARTPTAHAASHVAADPIQSATAVQAGLMTAAYASQLDALVSGAAPAASGIDNRVVRYNGTSALQSSAVSIDDNGGLATTYNGTDVALHITHSTNTGQYGILVAEDNVARSQPMVFLDGQTARVSDLFKIYNRATATNVDSIAITQWGGGHAIHIWLGDPATTNSALRVTEGGGGRTDIRTAPMLDLNADEYRVGAVISIVNPSQAPSINIAAGAEDTALAVGSGTISGTRGWKVDLSGDDGEYIYSSADGQLDLVADTVAVSNLAVTGNVDGRDISADGIILDALVTLSGSVLAHDLDAHNAITIADLNAVISDANVLAVPAGVDDRIVRFDGAGALQSSGWTIDDANALSTTISGEGTAISIELNHAMSGGISIVDAVATENAAIGIDRGVGSGGVSLNIDNRGSNNGIAVTQYGAADAIRVILANDALGNDGLVFTEVNAARTGSFIKATAGALATGAMVDLTPGAATTAAIKTRGGKLDLSIAGDGGEYIYSEADNYLEISALNIRLKAGTGVQIYDNSRFLIGTAGDASLWYGTAQTPDALVLGVGADSNGWVICEKADISFDFAHPLQTNPTVFIHSANQSTTQWIGLTHDQTNGKITTGAGSLSLAPANGTVAVTTDLTVAGNLTVSGSAVAKLDTAQVWTASQRSTVVTLSSVASAVAIDASAANMFYLNMTETTTLQNPTNQAAGQTFTIRVESNGSADLSYGTHYDWGEETAPDFSTIADGRYVYLTAIVATVTTVSGISLFKSKSYHL